MEFRDNCKIDNYCKESRICNRLNELFEEWDETSYNTYKSYGDIFEFFNRINEIYAKWIEFSDFKSFEIMKKLPSNILAYSNIATMLMPHYAESGKRVGPFEAMMLIQGVSEEVTSYLRAYKE